ncbi:MAG: hypothetical protein A3E84_00710 [Gammaproteobacteria bacterium RIFCSPHIGHO2_12_FULL_42_13]|nr:MAG: hypothetical protein A3E84_00710 [Gammaproteobacteria bacterium RIFCSPHIGHO2_12_FULL_42_13]
MISVLVIAICFAVQWMARWSSASYQFPWAKHYIDRMQKIFAGLMQGHGLFAVFTLVLPMLIAVSLVFTIIYHWLGYAGYALVSAILFWYCTDVGVLRHTSHAHMSNDLFLIAYQKIFAPLLWYVVLGPVGLALYYLVTNLYAQLPEKHYFALMQGAMDWIPIRVLGITFALAGNFSTVFPQWVREWVGPIIGNQKIVVALGKLALGEDHTERHVLGLLQRSLIIWLALVVLVGVSGWI